MGGSTAERIFISSSGQPQHSTLPSWPSLGGTNTSSLTLHRISRQCLLTGIGFQTTRSERRRNRESLEIEGAVKRLRNTEVFNAAPPPSPFFPSLFPQNRSSPITLLTHPGPSKHTTSLHPPKEEDWWWRRWWRRRWWRRGVLQPCQRTRNSIKQTAGCLQKPSLL